MASLIPREFPKLSEAIKALFVKRIPYVHSATITPFVDDVGSEINHAPTSPAPAPAAASLDLDDTKRLFSTYSVGALLRALIILSALAKEPIADLGARVLRPDGMIMRGGASVKAMARAAVKATVYKQFCAGENAVEAAATLQQLWHAGLRGILDYGVEDAEDAADCDRNLEGLLRTAEMTPSLPASSVSFICVKITAICPIKLLERVSHLLRWEQKDRYFNLPWKHQILTLPIFSPSSPLYHTLSMPNPLSETEQNDLNAAHQRLAKLCTRCSKLNIPLLIDAEYSSVQPAIDYFTFCAATEFNYPGELPLVWGTLQAYLKDAKDRLAHVTKAAEDQGISLGFKLVRGAYMMRESQFAASLGFDSPIHNTIQDTHKCYNDCAEFMMERIKRGSGSLILATHNVESGKRAAAKAEQLCLQKGNPRLQFAQLMGMADSLSLGLANAGFQVSKYLPFGSVDQIIPYLLRRAEENKGMLSSSTLDRQLIRKELNRRFIACVLGRN